VAAAAFALVALAASARVRAADGPAAVAGELTRVDLAHRGLCVKLDGRDGREIDLDTGPETRLLSRGRRLRLEDLRPGDRVLVVANADAGRRVARIVKVVGRPAAVPSAAPSSAPPG
jgi:hypothetical protein